MVRFLGLSFALLVSVAISSVATADDAAPDWSKFTSHGEISGVIAKSDLKKIVLAVPKLEKKQSTGGNTNNKKNRKPGTQVVEEDITISYSVQSLVRWEKLPSVADGKGGVTKPTGKELEKLRLPIGVPGYAAELTELKPGHIVTVQLVRPSTVKADKATKDDIVIKYVIIKGETTAPKGEGKDDPKKKK